LNAIAWQPKLPPLNVVAEQFQTVIERHKLRDTSLGQTLYDFGQREYDSGWFTIGNLPEKIHPNTMLCLCTYLMGSVYEVPGVGTYIMSVKEDSSLQANRPTHANSVAFAPHTERSYLSEGRPEFQFLYSIHNPPGRGGLTEITSISDTLAALDSKQAGETIRILSREDFLFPPAPSQSSGDMVRGSILEPMPGKPGEYSVRLRQDGLMPVTVEARQAVDALVDALNRVKKQFLLVKGQILAMDNRRAMHGRTEIISDPQHPRELNKIYVAPALRS
jgi:hypothetical protein